MKLFSTLCLLLPLLTLGCMRGSGQMGMKGGGMMRSGSGKAEDLYKKYCATCHGKEGDGKGVAARLFKVAPANFQTGVYKFKRTPYGSLPSDEDIYRSITIGARGTGMLPQLQLNEEERREMVKYLKQFSLRFQNEKVPLPMKLPPRPAKEPELNALGRQKYRQLGCAACHGEKGTGDGPAASSLKDKRGKPIAVPDLTLTPYKQGSDLEAIAWVLLAGREGSPMPSFAKELNAEGLWALANYVQSLQQGSKPLKHMQMIGEEVKAMVVDHAAAMAWHHGGKGMMGR